MFWAADRWVGRRGDMVLRRATEADVPDLVRLNVGVQEMHARHAPDHIKMPSGDPGCAEMFRQMVVDPTACLVVAQEGQAVVGYFFAKEVKQEESWIRPALRTFMLEHFVVDPAHRRKGIGQALISRFFDEARGRGIARVGLCCWAFNEEGRRFFRRHGFEEIHARWDRKII